MEHGTVIRQHREAGGPERASASAKAAAPSSANERAPSPPVACGRIDRIAACASALTQQAPYAIDSARIDFREQAPGKHAPAEVRNAVGMRAAVECPPFMKPGKNCGVADMRGAVDV
jgi:hypothetical protein